MDELWIRVIEAASIASGNVLLGEIFQQGKNLLKNKTTLATRAAERIFRRISEKLENSEKGYERNFNRFRERPNDYMKVFEDDLREIFDKDTEFKSQIVDMLKDFEKSVQNDSENITIGSGRNIAISDRGSVSVTGNVGGDLIAGKSSKKNRK